MDKKTIIAYIPALHKGYIDFLKKQSGKLLILDLDLVREMPRLERDIRAISAQEMQKSIEVLNICDSVEVLDKKGMAAVSKTEHIVMPDEDVSRFFAEQYLKDNKISYESVFLRWDKQISTVEHIVPEGRVISAEHFDKEIMTKAFTDAKKSSDWWRQIGAVVVKDDKPILVGHNKPLPSDQVHNIFGDPRSNFDAGQNIELSKFVHAEASLIAEAAKRGISLEGASIYVTTFPCPVCAKSVALAGIRKVYYTNGYSLLDAEDVLKSFGIDIVKVNL